MADARIAISDRSLIAVLVLLLASCSNVEPGPAVKPGGEKEFCEQYPESVICRNL